MYISVRDCHLPGEFGTIKAGLDAMRIDAVELEYGRDRSALSLDTPGEARESLADQAAVEAYAYKCEGLQVRVAALLLHNNFGNPDLDAEIDWVISSIRAAARLGAKVVRIDAIMRVEGDWPFERRTQHFADCMARVMDATSNLDVDMGIENHGTEGNDPAFLDAILNKVNSPRLGITIDTGNFYWSGKPLERVHQIIEHFAPRVKHTHVKSINYPADKRDVEREVGWEYRTYASPLREGDIDLRRIARALKAAGYTGDMCIENESLGRFDEARRGAVLIDDADYMREILREL